MLNPFEQTNEELNALLPYGESIRPLLTSSNLSDYDLKFLLQKRGIFIRSQQRNFTVPHIASIILSPREFEILKNRQFQKESNIKPSTAQAEWNGGSRTIVDAIGDQLDPIINNLLTADATYSIAKFNVINENPNKVIIQGEIKRNDWTKDVFSITTFHNWKLTVEKQHDNNIVEYKSEATVPETKDLISQIQTAVHRYFQLQKVVNPQKQIQKILATHFKSHQYRFEYLLSFTQRVYKSLAFQRIINIESGIDERQNFPDNFKWLKGNIGEISLQALKGRNLQETDIIEIGKIGILVFGEIEAEYRFSYSGASGKCVIKFGFPNYFEKRSHIEFETKIQKLDLDNQYSHVSKETVKRYLLSEFLNEKHKTFEEFKNANKADAESKGLDNQYLIGFQLD